MASTLACRAGSTCTSLVSSSLSDVLRAHVLPRLTIYELGKLSCVCSALQRLVYGQDKRWTAAATEYLPAKHPPLQGLDRQDVQRLLCRRADSVRKLSAPTAPQLKVLEQSTPVQPWLLWSKDSRYLALVNNDSLSVYEVESMHKLWSRDLYGLMGYKGRKPSLADLDFDWSLDSSTIVACMTKRKRTFEDLIRYDTLPFQLFTLDARHGTLKVGPVFRPHEVRPLQASSQGEGIFVGSSCLSFSPDATKLCVEIFWTEQDTQGHVLQVGMLHFVLGCDGTVSTDLALGFEGGDDLDVERYPTRACTPTWSYQGDYVVTYLYLTCVNQDRFKVLTDMNFLRAGPIGFNSTGNLLGCTVECDESDSHESFLRLQARFILVGTDSCTMQVNGCVFAGFASKNPYHVLLLDPKRRTYIQLFDLAQRVQVCTFYTGTDSVFQDTHIEFGTDDRFILINSANKSPAVSIWDASRGVLLHKIEGCHRFQQSLDNLGIAFVKQGLNHGDDGLRDANFQICLL